MNFAITAAAHVTEPDLRSARLGTRFGRLDLLSQLSVLAVESLALDFEALNRERIGICLSASTGSLSTDAQYWQGRGAAGGPSPTLFAYTLPSAAIGEIAIRFRLTGPNLCLVGADNYVLSEAADWLDRGETDGCICLSCNVVSPNLAEVLRSKPAASASAVFLTRAAHGLHIFENPDQSLERLCLPLVERSKSAKAQRFTI